MRLMLCAGLIGGELPDFSRSVAIKGDTIVIGDPNFGSTFEGRAYIFKRTHSAWLLEATLTVPEETFFFRELGVALAIDAVDGNRVLAGFREIIHRRMSACRERSFDERGLLPKRA